ncbi:MAG: quinol:cytochrome C oxidoreductase [Bacteroidetes bacterium]|nr:MAG: quinol:cytochrome C oxidoreductase [Bacteroidota bacterium]
MEKKIQISSTFKIISLVLIAIGIASLTYGFITDPVKTWANYLMNNYYFLSLGIGITFFGALQYITHSGWAVGFNRIYQAMGNIIPVIAILMIPILIFGMQDLYHWSHEGVSDHDALIAHKAPYLNLPFFALRYVIYFAIWIFLTQMIRRFSLKEDRVGGMKYFKKAEFWSKVYIFSLAFTFTLATFDWIMSIDVHWFSTIFAFRNFVMAFYHGLVVLTLILIILNKMGYIPWFSKAHLGDLTRFIFVLSIIWTYMWLSQYLLIWYANIPEETVYYLPRTKGDFQVLFWGEFVLNWVLPFLLLIPKKISTNKNAVLAICLILILGQWVDLYQQIIVGTYGVLQIGIIEIGSYLGFLGIFALVVGYSLSKTPLLQKNHPYLEESIHHH